MTLKTAVVAPMPSANERMAVSANPGRLLHSRYENLRSWKRVRIEPSFDWTLKTEYLNRETLFRETEPRAIQMRYRRRSTAVVPQDQKLIWNNRLRETGGR